MTDPSKQPEPEGSAANPETGSTEPESKPEPAEEPKSEPESESGLTVQPAPGEEPTPPIAPEPPPTVAAELPPAAELPSATPEPPVTSAGTADYVQPVPGAQPPRGSRRRLVIILALLGVVLLLIVAVLAFFFYSDHKQDSDHKAGKCIEQDGDLAKPVACDKTGAYKIIKRINNTTSDDGCPAAETELYYVNNSDEYVLCLKKN